MKAPTWTTILDAAGAALVVAGVALIYLPASLILAGAAVLLASWLRGGTGRSS